MSFEEDYDVGIQRGHRERRPYGPYDSNTRLSYTNSDFGDERDVRRRAPSRRNSAREGPNDRYVYPSRSGWSSPSTGSPRPGSRGYFDPGYGNRSVHDVLNGPSRPGSRRRLRSRSPPTRRQSYYNDLVDDIHYHGQNLVRNSRPAERYITAKNIPEDDVPVDDYGNPLVLNIDLNDEKIPSWTNNRTGLVQHLSESVSLGVARAFTDETDVEKIILTPDSNNDLGLIKNRRWIHLQQTNMSLKSLEELVVNTPGLKNDDLLIVIRLLYQVRKKFEVSYVHGKYLEATVLRGNCHSAGKPAAQDTDRHATFMNFPYFTFQAPPVSQDQQGIHVHPIRSLLQTVHLLESTKTRDAEQAICKLGQPNRFGKYMHVPQVWSIAIGSDLLITYSTINLSAMRGQTIEIQRPLSSKQSTASVLKVTDPFLRTLFFSLDLCNTWFELEELLSTQCDLRPDSFDICLKGNIPLTAEQWSATIASAEPPFIEISICFKGQSESDESGSYSDTDMSWQPYSRPPSRPGNAVRTDSPMPYTREEKGTHDKGDRTSDEAESVGIAERADDKWRPRQSEVQAEEDEPSGPKARDAEGRLLKSIVKRGGSVPRKSAPVTFLERESENGARDIVAEPESYHVSSGSEVSVTNELRERSRRERKRTSSLDERPRSMSRRSRSRRQHTGLESFNDRYTESLNPFAPKSTHGTSRVAKSHSHFDARSVRTHGRSGYYPSRPASPALSYRYRRDQASVRPNVAFSKRRVAPLYDPREEDIYYLPKEAEKSVPIVNIDDDNRSKEPTEVPAEVQQTEQTLKPRNPESFQSDQLASKSTATSEKLRKSRSSTSSHPAPPTKPSVLPILMWPTGPPASLGRTLSSEQSHKSSIKGEKGPPRGENTTSNVGEEQPSDSSLREILERIHNTLLTDTSSNYDLIFTGIETGHRKDTIYKLPARVGATSENNFDPDKRQDDIESAKATDGSIHEPSNSTSTSGEQVQMLEYQKKLVQLSSTTNNLLECFMPADFPNIIAWRYYGAVKRIIQNVVEVQKQYNASRKYFVDGTVWLVTDIDDPEYLEKHHLQPLPMSVRDCNKCSDGFPYYRDSDASDHILQHHFPEDKRPSRATAMLWIKKIQSRRDKVHCDDVMAMLERLCTGLEGIYLSIQEICDGVRDGGTDHNQRYRLPKEFVTAFRWLVTLVGYSSNSIQSVLQDDAEISPHHDAAQGYVKWKIDRHVSTVGAAVAKGKLDLTMMLRTQDYTESVKRYEAVGPYYTMLMALSNVQFGVECREPVEVYKEYIARLSFQVSQYPRRRLIRSLKYVEEELLAIYKIMREQHDQYAYLSQVLSSDVARSGLEARRPTYDLELHLINKLCLKSTQRLGALEQLLRRVDRLIEDTKTSVEINDDDHGKAILVFTVVTLVFLPLSFVASFLGMNTADIRNQTANQVLYWIIALPITAGVVIFALVLGYKYEAMRDYFERYTGKLKRE